MVLHWLDNVRCCCRYAGVVMIDSCTTSHGPDIKTALDTRAYPTAKVEIEHPSLLFSTSKPDSRTPNYIYSAISYVLDIPTPARPTCTTSPNSTASPSKMQFCIYSLPLMLLLTTTLALPRPIGNFFPPYASLVWIPY